MCVFKTHTCTHAQTKFVLPIGIVRGGGGSGEGVGGDASGHREGCIMWEGDVCLLQCRA